MITLVVENAGRRDTFRFPGELATVGRAEDNDLRVSSRFVSQHHCRFERVDESTVKLVDLDSQNGTRVNGEDTIQCRLAAEDRIDIGPITIWFERAPHEETAALMDGGEDITDPGLEPIQISTRQNATAVPAKLGEALREVALEFRRAFGDERGLRELESTIQGVTGELFQAPAFQRSVEIARLLDVTRAINSNPDLNEVLAMIMDTAIELTDSERGFLVLRDEQGQWKVRLARNFDQESVRGGENKISRSIAEQVARSGKAICTINAQRDTRFSAYNSVNELKLRSILCVPLLVRETTIGTLYLDNRFKDGVYGQEHLDMLESFADHAALAVENARLYEKNREQEAQLEKRNAELDELAIVLERRAEEATIRDAEDPKPLTREGLEHDYSMIVGESPCMIEMFRLLDRVASSEIPVLISGESGSGKELVAQALHQNGPRREKVFIKENCAAIPESLMESEFFGYKKGAFTGANADRKGLFEQAHGGTLFLDEIGEMSLDMQSKMLRVLQNGEIRPVGAREVRHVDVRIVTASNRDLRKMVELGTFREDLYYRLDVINVEVPPLRERMEDLPLLIEFFLGQAANRTGTAQKSIDPQAMKFLLAYHWPGNVRELQNQVQRAVALSGAVIGQDDLSDEILTNRQLAAETPAGPGGLKEQVKLAIHQKEREIILRTLEQSNWRKTQTAKALEISRPTLDQKIKLFGLAPYIERGRKTRDS